MIKSVKLKGEWPMTWIALNKLGNKYVVDSLSVLSDLCNVSEKGRILHTVAYVLCQSAFDVGGWCSCINSEFGVHLYWTFLTKRKTVKVLMRKYVLKQIIVISCSSLQQTKLEKHCL